MMAGYLREIDSAMNNWFTPVVKWLVYLCCGTLIATILFPGYVFYFLGARFSTTIMAGMVWQLFTYAMVHAGFGHLFVNLFSLWMFGTRLEMRWGSVAFVRFVLVVAAGAVVTHLLVTPFIGGVDTTIVGISGVVYGVLLAYAYYYPNDVVYLQFLLPVKVKYMVGVLGLLTLLSSISPGSSNVAHLTHLGGLVFGYLFVRFPSVFNMIPIPRFSRTRRGGSSRWKDL